MSYFGCGRGCRRTWVVVDVAEPVNDFGKSSLVDLTRWEGGRLRSSRTSAAFRKNSETGGSYAPISCPGARWSGSELGMGRQVTAPWWSFGSYSRFIDSATCSIAKHGES